jgi:hypothetical protein
LNTELRDKKLRFEGMSKQNKKKSFKHDYAKQMGKNEFKLSHKEGDDEET